MIHHTWSYIWYSYLNTIIPLRYLNFMLCKMKFTFVTIYSSLYFELMLKLDKSICTFCSLSNNIQDILFTLQAWPIRHFTCKDNQACLLLKANLIFKTWQQTSCSYHRIRLHELESLVHVSVWSCVNKCKRLLKCLKFFHLTMKIITRLQVTAM